MKQVKVSTVISAPCEDVFDFVADLSHRPAFADHYLKDFRLARPNPRGEGAAARFLLDRPMFGERAEIWITECDRPRRIVEEGRVGRRGRSSLSVVYEFQEDPGGGTRVELTTASRPKTAVDRFRERGARGWVRRKTKTALKRLRGIFEEPAEGALAQVGVAGYEPHTAPRFGDRVQAPEKTAATDG